MTSIKSRFISEFLGTFCLVFCGAGAIVVEEQTGAITHFGIALLFGLIVAAMIISFAAKSRAHINPSVSLAFFFIKKLTLAELAYYVVAQVLAAVVACVLLKYLFPDAISMGQTNPSGSVLQTFVLEVIITFVLMLVVLRIPEDGEVVLKAAISVGFTVFVLALFAGPITGASMNPARSIGPAVVAGDVINLWIYIVAPCLGSLLAIPVNKLME